MECIPTGVSFYPKEVAKLKVGDILYLKHEPVFVGKKEYPNAVAIYYGESKVGHLAESNLSESPQQRTLMNIRAGKKVTAEVTELIIPGEEDGFKRTYKMDLKLPSVIYMESFNEPGVIIEFDEEVHEYTLNGYPLLSGSTYASSKEEKPFDAEKMGAICSRNWKVPAEDIKSMWKSNGSTSANFGTVVHQALEHWETYKGIGATILENSKKETNPAMPKHPFIKEIIEDFYAMAGDENIVAEAFITYTKCECGEEECKCQMICGQIDRLKIIDAKKKICRVQDYKVNIGGEEKLEKYQHQLSFYAYPLIKTGWTVEGLDVFVLEDVWKHYELEVIDVTI